jgi:hypothetical protein
LAARAGTAAYRAARLVEVHVGKRRVVRATRRHHDVVDRWLEVLEEGVEGSGVVGVEDSATAGVEIESCRLQALGMAAGEDHIGALCAGAPGGRQPDARAPSDHDDGLSGKLRVALSASDCSCGGHVSTVARWADGRTRETP